MNTTSVLVALLLCISLVSAQTLKLQVSSGSNKNWIAVKDVDGDLATTSIEVKQSNGQWTQMTQATGNDAGYWTYNDWSKSAGFDVPLSFRMTGVNNVQITFNNVISTFPGSRQLVDSNTKYTQISASSLKLRVSSGSNKNWIAVQVIDAVLSTSSVEIKQASAQAWTPMGLETTGINTGYWTYNDWSKSAGFDLPLSFRFVGSNGFVVTLNSAVSTFPGVAQVFDARVQYTEGGAPINIPTTKPSVAPPTAAATTRPTAAATIRPTAAATIRPTAAATIRPTAAATIKPTAAPATVKPTAAPTTGACSAPTKMIVPLYVYPGAAWDQVIEGAKKVKTVAIINPYNGPNGAPNSDYVTYMQKLHDAGVEIVGYVYTQYGARSITTVKADIDTYASQFPLVKGIFLDEGASGADKLSYYQELHRYIMSMPGYEYNIINPGVIPDSGYENAATQIVSLESYGYNVEKAKVPSYGSCANKEKFSAIVHTVDSGSMESIIDGIINKGYFGYVFVTDGAGGCCTYNKLPTYYNKMATYIGSH